MGKLKVIMVAFSHESRSVGQVRTFVVGMEMEKSDGDDGNFISQISYNNKIKLNNNNSHTHKKFKKQIIMKCNFRCYC